VHQEIQLYVTFRRCCACQWWVFRLRKFTREKIL